MMISYQIKKSGLNFQKMYVKVLSQYYPYSDLYKSSDKREN